MRIHFDQLGAINSCHVVNYLLEKSRVTYQLANERNYTFQPAAMRRGRQTA